MYILIEKKEDMEKGRAYNKNPWRQLVKHPIVVRKTRASRRDDSHKLYTTGYDLHAHYMSMGMLMIDPTDISDILYKSPV